MPISAPACRRWVLGQLQEREAAGVPFKGIVDVGAGMGIVKHFYGPWFPAAAWLAIEIWEPYVHRFALDVTYGGNVLVGDVRQVALPQADVYFFGDVLEHMPAEDAVAVWDRARALSRWLVWNGPVTYYPQGSYDGNPHEEHVFHWSPELVLASFAGIEAQAYSGPVGAFIARGLAG